MLNNDEQVIRPVRSWKLYLKKMEYFRVWQGVHLAPLALYAQNEEIVIKK